MGLKSQFQIGLKQREKRKKARTKLARVGQNVSDYFYGAYYLKSANNETKG